MAADQTGPRVLIGPRSLEDRICRVVHHRETDQAWTEEWRGRAWVRAAVLVRHVLKAPPVADAVLARRRIPHEPGVLDTELLCA